MNNLANGGRGGGDVVYSVQSVEGESRTRAPEESIGRESTLSLDFQTTSGF